MMRCCVIMGDVKPFNELAGRAVIRPIERNARRPQGFLPRAGGVIGVRTSGHQKRLRLRGGKHGQHGT